MLRLFFADINEAPPSSPLLPAERAARAAACRNDLARRAIVGSWLLLLNAAELCGIRDASAATRADGKPYFTGSALHFNISHSGRFAVCAICDGEIGVDVEALRRAPMEVARKKLHPSEYARILSSPCPDTEFFRIWTAKESYLKYTGDGLRRPLSSFCVSPNGKVSCDSCIVRQRVLPSCVISVCCAAETHGNFSGLNNGSIFPPRSYN